MAQGFLIVFMGLVLLFWQCSFFGQYKNTVNFVNILDINSIGLLFNIFIDLLEVADSRVQSSPLFFKKFCLQLFFNFSNPLLFSLLLSYPCSFLIIKCSICCRLIFKLRSYLLLQVQGLFLELCENHLLFR